MPKIEVRQLRRDDDRSRFRSGDAALDLFFAKYAAQNQFRHHIGTTYVATEQGAIAGFATVAPASIQVDQLPLDQRHRFPQYPLPVLRVARLAVAESAQHRMVGSQLLRAVCLLAKEMASQLGCIGIVVDAKPGAVGFYARYGFAEIQVLDGAMGGSVNTLPMFLPLGSIPGVLSPAPSVLSQGT